MKEKITKDIKKMSREEFLYHNTELLLKKYRDVVWSIEASAIQAEISFELEMDCKLEEFLEMSYAAGMDVSGTQIQEQTRTLERNKKMLKIIETALNVLRTRHTNGETYYWILYYT
jgi:methanogenic corrinoid protein MtbC1